MKNVGIVYSHLYEEHDTGNHPECADRIITTKQKLIENKMMGEDRKSMYHEITPRLASVEQIEWIHPSSMIKAVEMQSNILKKKNGGITFLDSDTMVSAMTYDASLMATGGNFSAIDAIFDGKIDRSFVLCRPPGHHSNGKNFSGFCIFNNVALTTEYLFKEKGVKKVAIVDFDVHAGNGTESIFETGPVLSKTGEVLIFSIHQHPRTLYPGTCFVNDMGAGKQKGKICNLTLHPGAGLQSVKTIYDTVITPMLDQFKPEIILISAGFDAHHSDPLASLSYTYDTYTWMVQQLISVASKHCNDRIATTLEGGYNLDAISKSIANILATFAGEDQIYSEPVLKDKKAFDFTNNLLIPEIDKLFGDYWAF